MLKKRNSALMDTIIGENTTIKEILSRTVRLKLQDV